MLTFIYPERCPVCQRLVMPKGALIHPECKKKLDNIKEPICKKCGVPLSSQDEEYCEECICGTDRGWELGRSLFPYHGAVFHALRLVKNEGTQEFVRFFAKQMYLNQLSFIRQVAPECIVPVPLHPLKKRSRGFNQAELLAVAFGKERKLPVRQLLLKTKKTKDQKNLSKMQRIKNVKDAFTIDENALGTNIPKSVLLVDDVSTTGSTLTACANELKRAGVGRVSFLSVCVAKQRS